MLRVRLVAAAFAMSLALAGCSSSNTSSWLQSKPALQALQFESVPPGADVRTADGQTCRTPCSLAVPLAAQQINVAMNGYLPQTVPVDVHQDSAFSPATFAPNPVAVTLQAEPKPAAKPRKIPAAPKTAAGSSAPREPLGQLSIMAPEPAAGPQDSAFPPPPQMAPPTR